MGYKQQILGFVFMPEYRSFFLSFLEEAVILPTAHGPICALLLLFLKCAVFLTLVVICRNACKMLRGCLHNIKQQPSIIPFPFSPPSFLSKTHQRRRKPILSVKLSCIFWRMIYLLCLSKSFLLLQKCFWYIAFQKHSMWHPVVPLDMIFVFCCH